MTTGRIRYCSLLGFVCVGLVMTLWGPAPAQAQDTVFSGPQVGEKLSSFEILIINGDTDGTRVDPILLAEGKPTLMVFVHQVTRPGMALTRAITQYAAEQHEHGVRSTVVWLDDDQAAAEAFLRRAAASLSLVVPVGVSVDGGEGPGAYGLNRNVELTVLVAKENLVTANFALVQPSLTEASKIAGAIATLIDQIAPNQKQLEAFAYPQGQMMARGDKRGPVERQRSASENRAPNTDQ